ncbi:hypothetical protein Y032_0073g755 [Ancylostoma ceylanicum]|uniref:Uncharacterized protein n=1 Tax=Ancylostoma ceylanicum TaxID=53326 RepID=A0A016TVV1_9BILA|nr:hypothetical protein Y032_0073g755 [Ancylostoma ceylanicum]
MEEEKPEVGDHIETTLPPKSLTTPAFPATAEQPFDKLTTEIIQVKVTTGEDPVKVTQRKSNGGTVGGKEDDENGEDYAALREHSKNEMIFITVIVALVLFTLIFLTYLYLNYKKHTHITQTQFGNRSLVTAVPKTSHSSTAARGPRYSSRSSNRRPRSSFTPGRSSSKESYRRPRNPPPKPKKKAREPSIEYYDLVDLQRAQRGGGRRWL